MASPRVQEITAAAAGSRTLGEQQLLPTPARSRSRTRQSLRELLPDYAEFERSFDSISSMCSADHAAVHVRGSNSEQVTRGLGQPFDHHDFNGRPPVSCSVSVSGAEPYSVVAEVFEVVVGAAGFVAGQAAEAAVDGLPPEAVTGCLDLRDDVAAGELGGAGALLSFHGLFLGQPGCGKTHLAVALAIKVVEAGWRGYFTTADDMTRTLVRAQVEGNWAAKLKTYTSTTWLPSP